MKRQYTIITIVEVDGFRPLTKEEQFPINSVGAALVDIMSFQPASNLDIMEIVEIFVEGDADGEPSPQQVQPVENSSRQPSGAQRTPAAMMGSSAVATRRSSKRV